MGAKDICTQWVSQSPDLEDSLPHQSTQVQALEAAAQAAWRAGRDWVPQMGVVEGHEAEIQVKVQGLEEAVEGDPVVAHPALPHILLLSHHLEERTQKNMLVQIHTNSTRYSHLHAGTAAQTQRTGLTSLKTLMGHLRVYCFMCKIALWCQE